LFYTKTDDGQIQKFGPSDRGCGTRCTPSKIYVPLLGVENKQEISH
jgi:hypothetical protein